MLFDALRCLHHPEPFSGVATVHAFLADDRGVGPPWSKFAKDFEQRLAPHMLGFTACRARQTGHTPGTPATFRQPRGPDRATVRVDLDFPDRRSALLFHLIELTPVGSLPTWFTERIEVLDSS